MSIELQIQSSILGAITARAVQARLRTRCFDPIASVYVDHADVAATPVELIAANAAVRLRVPLDVFVVRREDVLAAPNGVPAGATVPAKTVVVVLEMAAIGAVVSLQCVDAEGAGAAKAAIVQAIGSPVTSDLTATLRQLGMAAPSSSRVELIGSIVAIRFEPAGAPAAHLFPGHEWGLFLDGASVEQLAESKVTKGLKSRIPSLTTDAHWRPAGDKPHVDIDYAGKVPLPDPFAGDVDGWIGCDFSLTPPPLQGLRTTVHWSLHINLGDFVPELLVTLVEVMIESSMDPTQFGGTPIGDHAFTVDSPLPNVSFGGARFGYISVVASPAGMTIGGAVRLPLDPSRETVKPSVHQFGLPYRLDFCSLLAKTGSGAPKKTASLGEVTTSGRVWLDDGGAFCDVDIVSPSDGIKPYLSQPGAGAVAETHEIRIVIPSLVALGITESVRFIVRTARGVRLVDLGIPPPATLDANGNVTNALLEYIDDCFYIPVGSSDEHGINWGIGVSQLTPPLPDWTTYLDRQRGIDVQLVTVSALEPGELIQFRSRDHAVDVTADRNGRALLPVLLPVTSRQEPASLIRVNRRSIAGHVTVRTAIFMDQVSLPAGRQHRLVSLPQGRAVLTTEFKNHIDVHEIGSFGAPILLKRETSRVEESIGGMAHADANQKRVPARTRDIVQRESHETIGSQTRPSHGEIALDPQPLPPDEKIALNPQPLPPRETGALAHSPSLARINLRGTKSLIAVPGFAEAPIALATMADGSMLILDLSDGTPRVSGTFAGPIGALDVAGDWGVAASPNRLSIYRVTRG
jgi:hypothetical protein